MLLEDRVAHEPKQTVEVLRRLVHIDHHLLEAPQAGHGGRDVRAEGMEARMPARVDLDQIADGIPESFDVLRRLRLVDLMAGCPERLEILPRPERSVGLPRTPVVVVPLTFRRTP